MLDTWLEATARSSEHSVEPAVRFSSCFPFQGDTLLVVPPRNLWPPPPSSKVRWKGAKFVPLKVVELLAAGKPLSEDGWIIDGPSECLLPFSTPPVPGPFRVSVRSSAAVDREGESVSPHSTACIEFTPGSGLWCAVQFLNDEAREQWTKPLSAAFRLLSDSGFGGKRSQGWGRAEMPEITEGAIQVHIKDVHANTEEAPAYWLLSLFHPASSDVVDWNLGNYTLTTRGGRVESDARWGDHKKQTRMVTEGSVLVASAQPRGSAADVAPEGFPHPVYRSGFALAIPIPLLVNKQADS
jgi:CRISPR type III-A-associated RAMP protein Csm4